MADYASFLYNAFGGVGDAMSARRQEKEGVRQYDQNYARLLDNDQYGRTKDDRDYNRLLSRDAVGDSQWERGFGADQAYRGQSLALQRQKMAQDAAGAESYGLTPVWGTDAEGKPALIQLGKGGQPIQPQLPDGFKIARDPIKMDAGTHFVLLDPQTRQQIGTVPKDVAGEAAANTTGKIRGEAQGQLPATAANARLVSDQVDALKNDPYLNNMVGAVDSWLPNVSSDAARVQGRMEQLQGGAFLQARQMLKGGGAITDYEGQKAEKAFARLSTAQNEADYRAALDEFNEAVQQGYAKLQAQAGGGQQQPSQAGPDGWQPVGNGIRMRQVR